ncbi:hypothetical protein GcC1_105014 [Golovinomyces cichoracearum]|uniref:DNA endonuclease activator Ctp1 C-terminal domain-containing protein n=1 Tax=Golovinomyces cichoracearum TaxID=62708 RepID=A0A420I9M1_9PEZI|nr:hypothetical protein GcC1_105014 [Golovinomyces cichoracearum]
MRSWEDGKKELQREFSRVCALIDENISAEINDSSSVQVKKEELCLLRENSARIEQLVENNARLVDEIKSCRAAAARIDHLEKENKKLTAELQENTQKLASTNNSDLKSNVHSAQKPESPSLSAAGISDVSEYKRLARKYNVVSENCSQLKAAWIKMKEKLRDQKKKSREWARYLEHKDAAMRKKSDRIKILEQELKRLNSILDNNEGSKKFSSIQTMLNPTSESIEGRLEFSSKPETNDKISRDDQDSSPVLNKSNNLKNYESTSCHNNSSNSFVREISRSQTSTHTNISVKSAETPPTEVVTKALTVKFPEQIPHVEISAERTTSIGYPIFTPTERLAKRKGCSGHEKISTLLKETSDNSPVDAWHIRYSKDSIDLDDIGEKFDTPKKRIKYDHALSKPCKTTESLFAPTNHVDMSEEPSSSKRNFKFSSKSNVNNDKSGSDGSISKSSESSVSCIDIKLQSEVVARAAISCPIARNGNNYKVFSKSESCRNRESPPFNQNLMPNFNSNINSAEVSSPKVSPAGVFKISSEPQSPTIDYTTRNETINSVDLSFPGSSSSPKETAHLQHDSHRHFTKSKKSNFRQGKIRAQPIENLNIWDFKINPNYNQGYEYAFSEVVRGHARNALQGCLKPCCQPQFRALAEISGNPSKKLTLSQEEAENLMLEEFLGDNAYKLRNMSKEDRVEFLIQAKTRDLANKHGIHKHAYEAQETPVGIWRADFPTTQEAFEDDKRIVERTRKIVEKRYAEAMRPGGAYKFRDE